MSETERLVKFELLGQEYQILYSLLGGRAEIDFFLGPPTC